MAKIKQSPKLPAEKRRQQLIDSVRKLLSKKCYHDITTEEIARNAGLTKGALYYHFKSKEDIFFELVKQLTEKKWAGFRQTLRKNMPPWEFLLEALRHKKRFTVAEFRSHVDFWGQAMSIPRIRRHINKCFRREIEYFADTIDPKFGKNKKERKLMAMLIFSLRDGLLIRTILNPSGVDMAEPIRLFSSIVESYSRGRAAGKR